MMYAKSNYKDYITSILLTPQVTFEKSKISHLILTKLFKPNEKCESFNNEQPSIFIL